MYSLTHKSLSTKSTPFGNPKKKKQTKNTPFPRQANANSLECNAHLDALAICIVSWLN